MLLRTCAAVHLFGNIVDFVFVDEFVPSEMLKSVNSYVKALVLTNVKLEGGLKATGLPGLLAVLDVPVMVLTFDAAAAE